MKARLDTIPREKFPQLYAALHRQNRIERAYEIAIVAVKYLALFAFGALIGTTLTYGLALLSLTGGAQ